jgi:hopanoid biosynthesis associated radical SAM protein HpnH
MPRIVRGYVERRKFVYLCTNALLLRKRLKDYQPSPYLTFSVHLDGSRDRHDASVCQDGVYERAVEAIREARARGFRVTVNCTLFQGESPEEVAGFLDEMRELDVEGVTLAPGFSYERAPQRDVFLGRRVSKQLFRKIFKLGRGRNWRLNHSSLYLDFLAGNQSYACTAWGNPTRNVFGWQKPCYLLVGEGTVPTYEALIEDTQWDEYGVGRNPKCADCMVHCGFEPTAVNDAVARPLKALLVKLRGPRTDGPMAPEPPLLYAIDSTAPESASAGSGPRRVA